MSDIPNPRSNPDAGNMTPFLSSAQVTLAASSTAMADSGALSQPFRRPFWLDEIRWNIRVSPVPLDFGSGIGVPYGALIRTKLTLGRMIISDKFIPIWNYGTELLTQYAGSAQVDANFGGVNVGFSSYRWKLPKPLYVPAGNVVTSEFSRGADGNPSALVTVSYAGRYVDADLTSRDEIDVPFVCAFLPATGVLNAQSAELDLHNPFLVPLKCQRMIGRILINDTATPPGYAEPFGAGFGQLQLQDSGGHNMITDFTDLALVFDVNRRAWTFTSMLPSQERYNVLLTGLSSTRTVSISLIGTRKEQLST